MDRTNANNFRSNMKEWMELARVEPVKITRKSGEAFVLVDAEIFEKMRLDLARLQGQATSLVNIVEGRISPATSQSTKDILDRAKTRALNSKKTIKRATG